MDNLEGKMGWLVTKVKDYHNPYVEIVPKERYKGRGVIFEFTSKSHGAKFRILVYDNELDGKNEDSLHEFYCDLVATGVFGAMEKSGIIKSQ